jgi:hypothetical protein
VCIIPKNLVISVKTCGVRKELEDAMIIGEVATALALMYEKSLGKKSHWFPYVQEKGWEREKERGQKKKEKKERKRKKILIFCCRYLDLLSDFEPLPYFWDAKDQEYLQGTDVEKIVAKYKVYPSTLPSPLLFYPLLSSSSLLFSSLLSFPAGIYHNIRTC